MYGANTGTGDDDATIREFVAQVGADFPIIWDLDGYWRLFEDSDDGISAFPIHVLIGRDGRLRYVRRRYVSGELKAAIESALAESP